MASNLNPKTAGLTLTGVLLGAEQYPSVVQQAVTGNTGYNLYVPRPIVNTVTPQIVDSSNGTQYTRVLMDTGGIYDLYVYVTAGNVTSSSGTFYLTADGTTLLSSPYGAIANFTGTVSAFVPAEAWCDFRMAMAANSGRGQVRNWCVFARQYA